jgi:hypothetical protein
MHNSWLNRNDQTDPKQSLEGPSHISTTDLSRPSADLVDEKPAQRATTTALSTPHDAVLAELYGRATAADMPTNETLATENPPLGRGRLNNPHRVGSTLSESSTTSEPLFDPFTGALIGDLLPGDTEQDRGAENGDDLWTHLSKILRLQSDIAEMHVQMEGIGLKKPGVAPDKSKGEGIHSRPSAGGAREWGENAADERVDEDADEEAENNRKREEEFSKLNDKFTGRKDAIDGIMKNVKVTLTALGRHPAHSWCLLIAGRTLIGPNYLPWPSHTHYQFQE